MSLSVQQLSVRFDKKTVLNDLSFQLPTGQFTALIGPNGCGKTTLLRTLAGLLAPNTGQVSLDNQSIDRLSAASLAKQLAFLPQIQPIPEGVQVRDLVAYGRSPYTGLFGRLSEHDWQIVDQMLAKTGTAELSDQAVSELSGGQRQRVWLAMILAQDTPYLLLDEPTTYMDINHQVELMRLIHQLTQEGKTIIAVLHDINQAARYCDHLIALHDGKIHQQGSPETVMSQALFKTVFQVDAQIFPDPISGDPMGILQ
jgi:ABC-type cobalamin/Fe3+-siderophores transport system ATPase subunit